MSDQLGWRMIGAICLMNATDCSRMGAKYSDASAGRVACILCSLFWLWMALKAWRRELLRANEGSTP